MTTLEAVNEILESIGEPPVNSLDTGGTSDEADAERILDRNRRRVLESGPGVRADEATTISGWAVNTEWNTKLNIASVELTGTISSGTFTQGEVVTQTSTGAQGIITEAYDSGDTTYLVCPLDGSADFDGSNNITGDTSSTSTATITAVDTLTSGVIQLRHDTIEVKPYGNTSPIQIVERTGRLYDFENNTDTFTDQVKVAVVYNLDWGKLTSRLQDHIVAVASLDFERFKRRGQIDEQILREIVSITRTSAEREHRNMLPANRVPNALNTVDSNRLRGHRNDIYGRIRIR